MDKSARIKRINELMKQEIIFPSNLNCKCVAPYVSVSTIDVLPDFTGWTLGGGDVTNREINYEYIHYDFSGLVPNGEIRNIYSNKKAGITIVIFNDDTKMEFKLSKGDKYDIDKVILMALTKKRMSLKTNSSYRKFMDKQRKLVTEIKTNKRPKKKNE